MKSSSIALCLVVIAAMASCISAKLYCEDIPTHLCAFSVNSDGSRCLLEKKILIDGQVDYECQTSAIKAQEFAEWVETDDCIQACGVDRMSVGISSDPLTERGFAKSLCSNQCQEGCPNIVDLFTKLAAGEGASLKQVCNMLSNMGSRREMAEVSFASLSSNTRNLFESAAAPSSYHQGYSFVLAPASSPSQF